MSDVGRKIITEVRTIAALNPNKKYVPPTGNDICMYFHGDQPGCIVGTALSNLGLLSPGRGEVEGKSASVVIQKVLGLDIDSAEGYWLDCVQSAQDGRVFDPQTDLRGRRATWGVAVIYADSAPLILPPVVA